MFQCLGLGAYEHGGCGEDWWHPECLVGFTREEYGEMIEKFKIEEKNRTAENADVSVKEENESTTEQQTNGLIGTTEPLSTTSITATVTNDNGVDGNDVAAGAEEDEDEDAPLPPGFPPEEDFDHFLCFKCVQANPWIKKYAGSSGFLPPVYSDKTLNATQAAKAAVLPPDSTSGESKKRKASDEDEEESTTATLTAPALAKRQKSEDPSNTLPSISEDTTTLPITPKKKEESPTCKLISLPPLPTPALTTPVSLFLKPDFRDHLCHCTSCFPLLKPHPQLLEEEDTYEPPVSEDGDERPQSVGTGSILDRGEAAFNNMDRVKAIQGAMAYAHLKDKVAAFLKPFAESGQAVGAEDVKAYFEKLRGDEQGIQAAAIGAKTSKDDEEGGAGSNGRREQSGY